MFGILTLITKYGDTSFGEPGADVRRESGSGYIVFPRFPRGLKFITRPGMDIQATEILFYFEIARMRVKTMGLTWKQ